MGKLLKAYLTLGPMGCGVYQGDVIVCGVQVKEVIKAVGCCILPDWMIFAEVVCLWYHEGSILIIIHTSSALI